MTEFYQRLGSPNRSALAGQSLLSSQEVNVVYTEGAWTLAVHPLVPCLRSVG